jgi:hypothetical protein
LTMPSARTASSISNSTRASRSWASRQTKPICQSIVSEGRPRGALLHLE